MLPLCRAVAWRAALFIHCQPGDTNQSTIFSRGAIAGEPKIGRCSRRPGKARPPHTSTAEKSESSGQAAPPFLRGALLSCVVVSGLQRSIASNSVKEVL